MPAVLLAVGLATCALAVTAVAADVRPGTTQTVVEAMLQEQEPSQLDRHFAWPRLAERVLGDAWASLGTAQRAEFVAALKPLVLRAWARSRPREITEVADGMASTPDDGTTRFAFRGRPAGEPDAAEGAVIVDRADGKVVDLETEGVRLSKAYRSQFRKILDRDGFAVLLQKMRDKAARP